MTDLNTPDAGTPPASPIAVFGLDGSGKPHCSYFAGGEAELATKAAAIMGMHVLPLDGPECDGLADQMPAGRIFPASGKAFVPFCKQPLYERLATLGGIPIAPAAPKTKKPAKVAAEKTKGKGVAAADGKKAKKAAPTPKPEIAPYVEPTGVPQDWPLIRAITYLTQRVPNVHYDSGDAEIQPWSSLPRGNPAYAAHPRPLSRLRFIPLRRRSRCRGWSAHRWKRVFSWCAVRRAFGDTWIRNNVFIRCNK